VELSVKGIVSRLPNRSRAPRTTPHGSGSSPFLMDSHGDLLGFHDGDIVHLPSIFAVAARWRLRISLLATLLLVKWALTLYDHQTMMLKFEDVD
jgi:hypothetical protein